MLHQRQLCQGTRIEYHILQSFPVTCLNRDDAGAPKTACVGGVTRARVSSQAWKRPVRMALNEFGVKLAVRTKNVAEYIAGQCRELGASEAQALACGETIAAFLSKDTLHFFTESEAKAFARLAAENNFDETKLKEKPVQALSKKSLTLALDGIDLALFGRMVAKAQDLNIEAAASFAHAISTHEVSNELDFFTALDDFSQEPGSSHMGILEFNSATYYRYVSLDLGQLQQNLDNDGVAKAIEAFTKALYLALPTARQATQSGACHWDYARVLIRHGQRLQLAWDKPVKGGRDGYLQPSIEHLKQELSTKEKMAGSLYGKLAEFTLAADSDTSIDHLVDGLLTYVAAKQASQS